MIATTKDVISSLSLSNMIWEIYAVGVLSCRIGIWYAGLEKDNRVWGEHDNPITTELAIMLVCFFWPTIPLILTINSLL